MVQQVYLPKPMVAILLDVGIIMKFAYEKNTTYPIQKQSRFCCVTKAGLLCFGALF